MRESRRNRDSDTKKEKVPAGRWTDDEKRLFVEAYEMFGKDWKKIKAHVGTRTGMQIRSHAQKFFKKFENQEKSAS